MQIYLMILTPKGRERKKDNDNLQKFMTLGGVFGFLEPEVGDCFFFDYKENSVSKKDGSIYPKLIGKRYWIDVGCRYSYVGRLRYINYTILELYHGETKQTAEEFLNNQIAQEFKRMVREYRKQARKYVKQRFS